MSKNQPVEAPVGADEKEAGREKKKKRAFHFPCLRSGTYDLDKAEKKYGIESGTHSDGQSVHTPCVQPEDEAGEEKKKKKRFWKWPSLHFPYLRTGTYDLDNAEKKYGIEAGNSWRHSNGQSVHEPCVQPKDTPIMSENHHPNPDCALRLMEGERRRRRRISTSGSPAPEVLLIAEEQLVQDILNKGHIRGQYKISHKLGGGCGSIYEGIRCHGGLKVAVKCSIKMPGMPSMRVVSSLRFAS
ncbi:hypothetical protein Q8A67_000980 [Cirrhinus molitorella]|uniref:Uncharacterized protein n=1 Tax=Cirrhinus molitorella TaxID=172907 RepID=A0AA88Q8Z1_9TELE|nr:hypothetical protein Q8A67_000980 [Cirrhinus molitorella]